MSVTKFTNPYLFVTLSKGGVVSQLTDNSKQVIKTMIVFITLVRPYRLYFFASVAK